MGAPRRASQEQIDQATIAMQFMHGMGLSRKQIAVQLGCAPSTVAPSNMAYLSKALATRIIQLGRQIEDGAVLGEQAKTETGILTRLAHLRTLTEGLVNEIRTTQGHANRLVFAGLKQAEADALRLLEYFNI